eukprot:7966502-Karenia_brevis.AAC.1
MREAGARVRENFCLIDAGLPNFDQRDGRRMEVVATGLSYRHGTPVAADCMMVSPLNMLGRPHPG